MACGCWASWACDGSSSSCRTQEGSAFWEGDLKPGGSVWRPAAHETAPSEAQGSVLPACSFIVSVEVTPEAEPERFLQPVELLLAASAVSRQPPAEGARLKAPAVLGAHMSQ